MLFSSIPDNTLNNALEYLSVETLPCNEEERLFFRKQLPHQTGPFSLIDERSLLCLHRYLLYCMQFQRTFPPRGYQSPLPSNLVPPSFSEGNFPLTPLPGQFGLAKDRNDDFSTSFTNNKSGPSFSTCDRVIIERDSSKIELGDFHCKYVQGRNEYYAARFPDNNSVCPSESAAAKSDVRQVISSHHEENRSGQIRCTFEEENTAEHSASRLWSKNYASPSKTATSESEAPSIQCVELESRWSQVEKDEIPSHTRKEYYAARFPNNKSVCPSELVAAKSDVRQVISSHHEENRSGQIRCTFEEENTAEHSASRLWSKNYASPSKTATSESEAPSIQCVELESRWSQVEKDETSSHTQERSVLMRNDSSNEVASCDEKRQPSTLSDEELSPDLRSEFSELRNFYSLELNTAREGCALQKVTIKKIIERVSRYLWFLKNVKNNVPLHLFLCTNPEFVEEFIRFMMDKRGVKAVTCSRYISAFINISKVPLTSFQNFP